MSKTKLPMREQLIWIFGIGGLALLMVAESWAGLGVPVWAKLGVWFVGICTLLAYVHVLSRRVIREQEDTEDTLSEPTYLALFIVTIVGALLAADFLGDRYDLSFWARILIVVGIASIGSIVNGTLRARWRKAQ